jgi:hypothetical protein
MILCKVFLARSYRYVVFPSLSFALLILVSVKAVDANFLQLSNWQLFFGDRYAREDTHYLLHIYDLMRALLLSKPIDNENADPPLLEVWF